MTIEVMLQNFNGAKVTNSKLILSIFLLLSFSVSAIAHDGHHNKPAWEACNTKELNTACFFVMQKNKLYEGTCKSISDDLMCVRNKPIMELTGEELAKLDVKMPEQADALQSQTRAQQIN